MMLPGQEPQPISREELGKMFQFEVVAKAKGFKTEGGPTSAEIERQRELEQKEQ